jgi:predicted NAD-dependent protein-ADP-ribosyltransferase YbiA (DUF1768 family)
MALENDDTLQTKFDEVVRLLKDGCAQQVVTLEFIEMLNAEKTVSEPRPMVFAELKAEPKQNGRTVYWDPPQKNAMVIGGDAAFELFYANGLSNWAALTPDVAAIKIAGTDITLTGVNSTELLFKLMCYIVFYLLGNCTAEDCLKPKQAKTLAEVKASTMSIKDFDRAAWDALSERIMLYCVALRLTTNAAFQHMKDMIQLAADNGVSVDNISDYESTNNDGLWGTGVHMHKSVVDLVETGNMEFPGKNKLGKTYTMFYPIVARFTHEEYVAFFTEHVTPLLAVASEDSEGPLTKKSKLDDDVVPELGRSDAVPELGRSDVVPELGRSESVALTA